MCLIAFAIGVSPDWPLVIASNRDEFLSRPTLPLAHWMTDSGQPIISGRDLLAGGTWLGITPGGRTAFLTNVRTSEPNAAPRSRGELVTRWLESKADIKSFLSNLKKQNPSTYGGFNLVLGDIRSGAWHWVSNKSSTGEPAWQARLLGPGIFGLSNAALDTPWPKTSQLKGVLQVALASQHKVMDVAMVQKRLWNGLASRKPAAENDLPATGVSRFAEKALSSAFVEYPEIAYGTRSSTLLIANRTIASAKGKSPQQVQVEIAERTYVRSLPEFTNGAKSVDHRQVDLCIIT